VKTQIELRGLPGVSARRHPHSGLSLLELLCVIAIIAIIAALYLGVIAKAFIHIKKTLGN
jgi:prepilin-type N-terminal cleavage/methylation domain-containing protein